MKKYNLDLVAATFIILDSNEASMQVSLIDHLWKASLYRLFFSFSSFDFVHKFSQSGNVAFDFISVGFKFCNVTVYLEIFLA